MTPPKEKFRGSCAVTFEAVSRARWEAAFGSEEERQKRFRAALDAQKAARKARLDALPEKKNGPAILDDSSFRGFCPSLGIELEGRSHLKRIMKERGLRPAS